ncbi:MAG: hypothetical protein FD177_2186 [Desulfovibrionaceae bacterium]|nr:MAG: hypothetical protein FD177_2186 [Desulfovibrionaceae bacterium]
MIFSLKGQIQQNLGNLKMARTNLIKDGLDLVGELSDVIETEHGSGPFEGMHGTEHAVDEFHILGGVLKLKQSGLELHQEVGSFVPECLAMDVFHVRLGFVVAKGRKPGSVRQLRNGAQCYRRTFCTTASSCSGLKGFTIQPVAPASLPSCFLPAWDSVVSMTMGMNL